MSGRIENTPITMTVREPVERQTAKCDFASKLKVGIVKGAEVFASGAQMAAPIVPGGALVSAAATGMLAMAESASGSQLPQGSDTLNMLKETERIQTMNQQFNVQYLQLQEKLQQESREFNLISNIMKVKHDAAKAAIQNIT